MIKTNIITHNAALYLSAKFLASSSTELPSLGKILNIKSSQI